MESIETKIKPPLDESFRPAVLANRIFRRQVEAVGVRLVIGLERSGGEVSRFETLVYPEGHPDFESNLPYVERIVKFLLWQRGGHTVYIGGPKAIADHIRSVYSASGARQFDSHFMGRLVYEREFSVVSSPADEVPASRALRR